MFFCLKTILIKSKGTSLFIKISTNFYTIPVRQNIRVFLTDLFIQTDHIKNAGKSRRFVQDI